MRILFVHASGHECEEYKIHRILAEHADQAKLDCYFVWQDCTRDRYMNRPANLARTNRNFFWDFGRDLSLSPKPSKCRRALMMLWRLPGSLLFLWRVTRQIQPDMIYTSQQSYELWLVWMLRRFLHIPHLIHIHYTVGPWLGNVVYRIILRTPHLLACSEFIRQWTIRAGVPPEHIDTLFNPADIERFDVPRDRGSIRAEFGWCPETPVVVAAGRLDPSKRHMLLLEAFAKVHHELPEARLVSCGTTTTRNGYDALIKQKAVELELDSCVIFAGKRKDLPTLFGGADLFCLPTENEPFGLVFVEAMVARLPAVACRSGAVPEIVLDQETGLLSELGEASSLATNVLRLLRDRELALKMGAAGRQRALSTFAPEILAEKWTELLFQRWEAMRKRSGRMVRRETSSVN